MIVVRLMGGLGNQMFQAAWGLRLAQHHQTRLYLDTSFLLDRTPQPDPTFVYRGYDLDVFEYPFKQRIPLPVARTLARFRKKRIHQWMFRWSARGLRHIKERRIGLHAELLTELPDNCILDGYWQSIHYFAPIEEALKTHFFRFRVPMDARALQLDEEIRSAQSICLNVRRTDFLTNSFHGAMGNDYFQEAVRRLAASVSKPRIYVFSDDVEWCRKNLKFDHPTSVVDHTYKGFKFSTYLRLMAACRHFIIPNSTFAWWAAWLGSDPEKRVIAPRFWFNPEREADFYGAKDFDREGRDLVPAEWERL